jgi:membrane-associated phospholipid phosphatase
MDHYDTSDGRLAQQPHAHRSALRRTLSMLHGHYRAGVATLDPEQYRRWKRTIAIGALLLGLLVVALVEIGRSLDQHGGLQWEKAFLVDLGKNGPFTFSTAVWYQTFGTDITLVMLILLTAGIAVYARKPIYAWSIILAYIAIDPAVRLGWLLWDRARPHILYDGVAVPAFHSFPSGHTGKTLAVYGILAVIWIRASRSYAEKLCALLLLAAIAVVVPLGRLSMGVHWPSDILGGWIIGMFWLLVLVSGLRFERR